MSEDRKVIVLAGGGSGGHLTPLIPIAESLKQASPDVRVIHIGQKGDRLNSILTDCESIETTHTISAGKFRRYHGESILSKLFDFKTIFFNFRDFFRFIAGTFQAWSLLGKLKPSAILLKGGYVCAPVGIAARLRGIPYITHDSDAMVSLAHRLVAKNATAHLTAMDPKLYLPYYQASKTHQVGVPVRSEYQLVTPEMVSIARAKLELADDDQVLLVVGGGLGSRNINNAVLANINQTLDAGVTVIVLTGHKLFEEFNQSIEKLNLQPNERELIRAIPFSDELHNLSAAANVVITRAGATNMAEFASQGKPCIVVPSPFLAGGHQLKNAIALEEAQAAIVIQESELSTLVPTAINLLHDSQRQAELSKNLHSISQEDAAKKIAYEILKITENNR